jgi:hypothetical protein
VTVSRLWLWNVLEPNLQRTGGILLTQQSHETISGLHTTAPTDCTDWPKRVAN